MTYLVHHGIKGQRWGVKNGPPYPIEEKAKGGTVVFGERPTPAFTKFIAKYFPAIKKNIENDKQFNIVVDGKRVGDAEIFREAPDSLNVVWVGINSNERGKGYGQAVMRGIIRYAKSEKYKQITLEVPGNSPDARHIYEKLGFVAGDQITNDDYWDGLTAMTLKL